MTHFTEDYLLNKKVSILQPTNGYRASSDAVLLASLITDLKNNDRVLDVGSGTGAVSLCLAYRYPQNEICGLEIQQDLVNLANQSAQRNNFAFLHYFYSDIREKKLPVKPCSFSHVVTNPPYYEHDVPSPNRSKALAHQPENFNLESWLKFCLKMLKPFGRLYLIDRVENLDTILTFLKHRAGAVKIIPLYSKAGQAAKRILIAAQKDSKAPLTLLPPFYTHNDDGSYTVKADKILRNGNSFFDD